MAKKNRQHQESRHGPDVERWPANPAEYYKDKGWVSYNHFFGLPEGTLDENGMPIEEEDEDDSER